MRVIVTEFDGYPIDNIARAAGTSTARSNESIKRVQHCFNNGHMSVFEFTNVTFYIEGISRACSHQLVRHRHMSFCQKSQRYTKVEEDDWYVVPPSIENVDWYKSYMDECLYAYHSEILNGVKPEDARFLLPEATKTDISVCTNARELFHFFDQRITKEAQWEIRDLAIAMKEECKDISDQWKELIEMWENKNG